MQPNIQRVIEQTQQLIKANGDPDPAMVSVLKQLQQLAQGTPPDRLAIGVTIVRNFDPAPTPEIEQWADSVLAVWGQARQRAR